MVAQPDLGACITLAASWLGLQSVPASPDLSGFESGWRGWLCAEGSVSCLLMGLGHPALLPRGWTRLGLFSGSFVSHPLACWPATLLPPVSLAGRSTLGLLTHLLQSTSQALGKEAHLGLSPFWELGPAPAPSLNSRATAQLHRLINPMVREGPLGQLEPRQHPAFPPLPQVTGQHSGWDRPPPSYSWARSTFEASILKLS